ncbi:unnamed protein product [Lasius platythorax]|uniref:Uncharacterized protein n=1 Tax=Lasius platythorax TaxID=488582 RepID=A0AAV2P428_9HYME
MRTSGSDEFVKLVWQDGRRVKGHILNVTFRYCCHSNVGAALMVPTMWDALRMVPGRLDEHVWSSRAI